MKNKSLFLIVLISFLLSSCVYENQDFPSPEEIAVINPSSIYGNITATITNSDTSYTTNINTLDTVLNNQYLFISGQDTTLHTDGIQIVTISPNVGIYALEIVPPNLIPQSLFVFYKYNGVNYQAINMTHGSISILEKNEATKKIKGTFNVNNIGAGVNEYTISGTFDVHWRE